MQNLIFADKEVGFKCSQFLLENYESDIKYIVVVNENSIVYKKLKNKWSKKIIFFNKLFDYDLKQIDYIFLIWWPFIIKEDIINLATKEVINTHPSLLPYNRGKHFNFWTIVEDVPYGVTLHCVDSGIDSGDILFQKKIAKSWEDTGLTLYVKAQKEMIELFKESYMKIRKNDFVKKKQVLSKGTYHNAKDIESVSQIFLDQMYSGRELLNLLRAKYFPPYTGCFFYDNGKKYEIKIKIKEVDNE